MAKITKVLAREILNSKGVPTVEAYVEADDGSYATASSPTGTSVGTYEAKESRDNDPSRYMGLGVLKAVDNIMNAIGPRLIGIDVNNQREIDKAIISADGTMDKSNLGTNATLAASMASAKAGARSSKSTLYSYLAGLIGQQGSYKMPVCLFNILNGGKHAGNNLDFQEFIIIPASSMNFSQALNMSVVVYQSLKNTLKSKGASTLIGDEGGFGPSFGTNRDALVMLNEAIGASNYRLSYDVFLGLDASANTFYQDHKYQVKDRPSALSSKELVAFYAGLIQEFNFLYLEDPFAEDDWEGWQVLSAESSSKTLIVGDDLTATNILRLHEAVEKKALGGFMVKPNQIGTVMEALAATEAAKNAGLKIVVSHRSGDTNDDFIADFAVAVSADYVKFGAPARGERVAKYNRLLQIEQQIQHLEKTTPPAKP
jgi:enolase